MPHDRLMYPGFTLSESHGVTGTLWMMNNLPGCIWPHADDVARAGIDAVERGQVICVPGWRYKLLVFVAKHLPESWMVGLMKRNSRKYRKVD